MTGGTHIKLSTGFLLELTQVSIDVWRLNVQVIKRCCRCKDGNRCPVPVAADQAASNLRSVPQLAALAWQ